MRTPRDSMISAATLVGLAVLLLGAVLWGWAALTEPFSEAAPEQEEQAPCVDVAVAAGDQVAPDQVMVSVINAGTREGLAGLTMDQLTEFGFAAGSASNARGDEEVPVAVVWAPERSDPAAQMVRSYLGEGVVVEERESPGPGVTVVVGDGFTGVIEGVSTIEVQGDTTVCEPTD